MSGLPNHRGAQGNHAAPQSGIAVNPSSEPCGIGSASGRPAIWRYLFTPATVAMAVGLTLIAYSVIKPDPIYTIGLLVLPAAAFACVLLLYPRVAFAGEDFRSGDRRLT
jgi:hypothetical protein